MSSCLLELEETKEAQKADGPVDLCDRYIFGALLYAIRFPERTFPRTFDIFGSSHQIFRPSSFLSSPPFLALSLNCLFLYSRHLRRSSSLHALQVKASSALLSSSRRVSLTFASFILADALQLRWITTTESCKGNVLPSLSRFFRSTSSKTWTPDFPFFIFLSARRFRFFHCISVCPFQRVRHI